ncbi:hypothetical protein PV327_011446, partial [Microctonus hyperodae]
SLLVYSRRGAAILGRGEDKLPMILGGDFNVNFQSDESLPLVKERLKQSANGKKRKKAADDQDGIEAHSAVKLITDNPILKKQNIEVGIFIGDNDSSSISAIRHVATHPVLKLSDNNHTSKDVKNMLFRLKNGKTNVDPDKELSNDSIAYLHRCFSYAVAQNVADIPALAAAVKNIPYHAFNKHDECRSWCGFKKNPETYKHSTVHGGFKNQILFNTLVEEFKNLAKNASQFVGGGSTQGNESVNSIMARKAPKSVCYSVSESCDFRYGCTRLLQREGKLSEKLLNTSDFVKKKKIRSQWRFRREANEIDTYESNMGLTGDESNKENLVPISEITKKKIVSVDVVS